MDRSTRPLGVIFDWDGVIIDSHDQHRLAFYQLAEELEKPFSDELFAKCFGMRNQSILGPLLGWVDPADTVRISALADRKEHLYREVLKQTGIEPLPGVVTLLEELAANGIPCSVGSSTPHENIRTVMEITGIGPLFAAVTAAEDVRHGKPDPEVFLIAASRIGREPGDCVVFEDAHVGIEAARRGGMKVIGVATTHPAESLAGSTDLVVGRLTEMTVTRIRGLWV
ncbi:MAG: HAD family phosphatase [Verrucomicrobiales bacterium]